MHIRPVLAGLLVLAAAACAERPAHPARAPLPACEPARYAREAYPPSSSQRESLILLAVQEWVWFDRQEIDFTGPSAGAAPRGGARGRQQRCGVWSRCPGTGRRLLARH